MKNAMNVAWLPWWVSLGLTPDLLEEQVIEKSMLLETSEVAKTYMQTFSKHMAVLCVFTSNQHEGTLPQGFQQYETFNYLNYLLDGQPDASESAATSATWNSDGKSPDRATARRQLLQHMHALKYICYECEPGVKPLTVEMVQHTHRLLMQGAVLESGQPLEAGHFRLRPCSTGTGQVYLTPGLIAERTAKYVEMYNAAVAANVDVIKRAADLFYNLIHLVHPFSDGNGRLGRLLVAYALMAGGVPFPLPLVDGHHKSRKHYQDVVLHYARLNNNNRLQFFILDCLHHKWVNFAQQVEVMEMVEEMVEKTVIGAVTDAQATSASQFSDDVEKVKTEQTKEMRKAAEEEAHKVADPARGTADEASKSIEGTARDSSKEAPKAAEDASKKAEDTAKDVSKKAKHAGEDAFKKLQDTAREAKEEASQKENIARAANSNVDVGANKAMNSLTAGEE